MVVPDEDSAYFKNVLPSDVEVRSDSHTLSREIIGQIKNLCPSRYRWYVQQFVKIATLFAEASPENVLMMWDGDTLQTRKITHIRDGAILYATSEEYHIPYFESIWKSVGLDKQIRESFTSQYLVLCGQWLLQLQRELGGPFWIERLISSIDFSEGSGLNEQELLGTFAKNRYPSQFRKHRNIKLERLGNSRLGGIDRATSPWRLLISGFPHLVAFESWDPIMKVRPLRVMFSSRQLLLLRRLPDIFLRRASQVRWKVFGLWSNPEQHLVIRDGPVVQFLSWFVSLDSHKQIIQVRTNDGVQNDFVYPFREHERPDVEHVLIEPHPYYARMSSERYANRADVTVIDAAVGESGSEFDLHYIEPSVADHMNGDGPPNGWAHGQGSVSRARVVKAIYDNSFRGSEYRRQIPSFIDAISVQRVTCIPLASFNFSARATCLVVDVQGMEMEVLSTLDSTSLPEFAVIEDEFEDDRISQKMTDLGYDLLIGGHDKVFQHRDSKFSYKELSL